jgi:hypothetical protein
MRLFDNPHYTSQLQSMGLDRLQAFSCIFHFLLQPKPEIFRIVSALFHNMTDPANHRVLKIGIQIRTGDHTLAMEEQNHTLPHNLDAYSKHFRCAQQIEAFALQQGNYSHAVWYLVSDSLALRRAAVKSYGAHKVWTHLSSTIEHSSKEQSEFNQQRVTLSGFKLAAAEWYMFSMTDFQVITKQSGFGRSAAMLRAKPHSVYTIVKSDFASRCDAGSFTPMHDLGSHWAGIR